MSKLNLSILIILVSLSTYSQISHIDAAKDMVQALKTLQSLNQKISRNGWENSYNFKTYNSMMQNASRYISNASDKLNETISRIEKIEKKNRKCLNEELISELKNLKSKLKNFSKKLDNLDDSEISSRIYTIYKYPKNRRYIRAVSREISNYMKSTFNDLKEIQNSMVRYSKNYDYFRIDVTKLQSYLTKNCN